MAESPPPNRLPLKPSHTGSDSRPSLALLTSLRFFAAIDVIVYHRAPPLPTGFPANLAASGYDAVSFFFILSGFILTYVYAAPHTPRKMTASSVAFWWARFSRILPAYIVSCLLSAPIFVYSGLISRVTPFAECLLGLVLVPTLLQAWWPPVSLVWNGPAWSLSVEAFFYAMFPWLMRLTGALRAFRWVVISAALIVGTSVIRSLTMSTHPGSTFHMNLANYWPLFHLPSFILGMALGRLFLEARPHAPALSRWLLPAGATMTIALLGGRSWMPPWAVSPPFQSIAYATLIYGAAVANQTGPLTSKSFLLLGDSSYAMYILHEPLSFWWNRYIGGVGDERDWSSFFGFFITVICLSTITHLCIELPGRRWLLRQITR